MKLKSLNFVLIIHIRVQMQEIWYLFVKVQTGLIEDVP